MDPPDILLWCCSRQWWWYCLNWKRPGAVGVEFSMARQWGDTAILSIFFWYWYGFLFQCRVFPAYNFLHYQYKSTNNLHLHLQDAADVGPKNNADKLSRWFFVMLVPKLFLTPIKIRIFGQKRPQFGPKSALLVILGQILPFFCTFCPMPDQKTMWTGCLGGFSVMWATKLLISPEKKGFFVQKRPNLAQNGQFWSIWARQCRLIQCPVGGSVCGCVAGHISQDTYLLYLYLKNTEFVCSPNLRL